MKRLTLIACTVLLFLAACDNHDNEPTLPSDDAIAFDAEVSARGTVTATNTITNFGVFCYYTGDQRWATVGTQTSPNKLYNAQVTKDVNGKWTYGTPVAWTDLDGNPVGVGYFFHFFAYSPYADPLNNTDVLLNTSQATKGTPALTYSQAYNIGNQKDLLVATPIVDRMHLGNRVAMTFRHALSRIGFSACINDATTSYKYTVTELSLTYHTDYGNIYRKATLDIGTLLWSDYDEMIDNDFEEYPPMSKGTLDEKFQSLQTDAGWLFYIPQELQAGAITMSLTVQRAKASDGSGATTKNFQNIPVPSTLWELGKSYNYQYTISYETTKIALSNVQIVGWTTSSGGSMDIN